MGAWGIKTCRLIDLLPTLWLPRERTKSMSEQQPARCYSCNVVREVHNAWLNHFLSLFRAVVFVEPLGSSAPNFPTESRMQTSQKAEGSAVAITCSAQGHPPPESRFETWNHSLGC